MFHRLHRLPVHGHLARLPDGVALELVGGRQPPFDVRHNSIFLLHHLDNEAALQKRRIPCTEYMAKDSAIWMGDHFLTLLDRLADRCACPLIPDTDQLRR